MSILDLDSSLEFNLYTNTAQNIKAAKKDIISKRREIHHLNSGNDVLKEIQVIEDEKSNSKADAVVILQDNRAQGDVDGRVVSGSADVVQQKTDGRNIPRRSTRHKNTTASDSSCISLPSTEGQRKRSSKRRKSNNVIVLDEDYPEPVSSTCIGKSRRRKLSEDDVVIVEPADTSLDVANVPDMYEDENEEITIVVKWKQADVHKFQIRRFQNVSSIFEFFAAKEHVAVDEIVLLRNDKEIQQSDSPDSLGFKCIAMLDGDIKLNRFFYGKSTNSTHGEDDIIDLEEEECLTVKVQAKHLKQPIEMKIKKEQKMNILIIKCCEEFNCPQNKLTLKFDGDIISPKDTADGLGLEGGECFDAYIH